MGALFYIGLAGLGLFEFLCVYFIMPMPGSQRFRSLDFAYFLYGSRWVFRTALAGLLVAGSGPALRGRRKWIPICLGIAGLGFVWQVNFEMAADQMFKQPRSIVFKTRDQNRLDENSVVLGVERHGEARAYPIRFLVYHHQVQDTIGGEAIMVTYCSVCRSGRVFLPSIDGRREQFRLVGMDHFNAMFEDATTKSWWRQATGQAVAGPLKGTRLAEVPYRQVTLKSWFEMHANAVVMQADETAIANFDPLGKYERGQSTGDLTRTDRTSWQDKAWVLGVEVGSTSKAYDWNRLVRDRIINDEVGNKRIVLALAKDGISFAAFERSDGTVFTLDNDVLVGKDRTYGFDGRNRSDPAERLTAVSAHQEFWHSWRTFHPDTLRDP